MSAPARSFIRGPERGLFFWPAGGRSGHCWSFGVPGMPLADCGGQLARTTHMPESCKTTSSLAGGLSIVPSHVSSRSLHRGPTCLGLPSEDAPASQRGRSGDRTSTSTR